MTMIVPISAEISPAEVCLLAERRLRESPYYFLKSLTCRFSEGVLTLCGNVPDRRLSPIAEAIVARVPSVRTVVNRVEVLDPSVAPWSAPAARIAG
jgi:hypothetical protein